MLKYHIIGATLVAIVLSGTVVAILDAFISHEMNRLALPFDRCLGCVPGINESAPAERDLELAPVVSGGQIRFVR